MWNKIALTVSLSIALARNEKYSSLLGIIPLPSESHTSSTSLICRTWSALKFLSPTNICLYTHLANFQSKYKNYNSYWLAVHCHLSSHLGCWCLVEDMLDKKLSALRPPRPWLSLNFPVLLTPPLIPKESQNSGNFSKKSRNSKNMDILQIIPGIPGIYTNRILNFLHYIFNFGA